MATAPYGVRLLVGAAVTAIEETRKIPQTILTYPMTVASQLAHLVMKMQQDVADLVIKGDEALESLFPEGRAARMGHLRRGPRRRPCDAGGRRGTPHRGRFALFTGGEPATDKKSEPEPIVRTTSETVPEIVEELEYETLTLAQLRARLTTLRVADLEALLAYEEASKARAPFQTLLSNRITRATAK